MKVFSRTLQQLSRGDRFELLLPTPETPWWDRFFPGTALRAIELLGVAGIGLAIYALLQAQYQTTLAQQALKDQRISSAWQILAIPGSGSTGKAYALETLIAFSNDVAGLSSGA
jgi:hypothetical protein